MLSSNDLAHEMPGQHVSSSPKTDSDLPSFKRIRLVTKEDIDACYSILSSYIQHPEAAALVEELIIDPPAPSFYPFAELEDTPCSVSDDFDEEAHNSIVQFAKGLSLGAGLGNTLLQALDLNSSRAEHGEGDDQPPTKRPRVRRFCELSENSDFDCAIIILLITLCPNIVTLRLGFDSIGPPLSQFFLGNNYGELKEPFLQKLRDVQFHPVNCDDERNYNYITSMEYFQYFHRLPAVYSFSLEGFEDYQADSTFFPPKVSSPSLRKIHIGHSHMSGKMISSIMLIPRTLEEFSFSTFGLINTDGGTSLIYPKTIAKCLLEYRSSLRVLDLDAQFSGSFSIDPESDEDDSDLEDYEVQPGEEENCVAGTREWYTLQDKKDCEPTPLWADDPANAREYPRYTIGSLRDFVTLTHLSIRIGLLLGYDDVQWAGTAQWTSDMSLEPSVSYRLIDALPPNLESLRLYGYKKGDHAIIDSHVNELLEKKAELFPSLLWEIEGIDEYLPGVPGTYEGDSPSEDELWQRPTDNLDWA